RLLDWLLYGLPAVVTVTAELTEELVQEGLAFDFPHGDSAALAKLLIRLSGQRETLGSASEQARRYVSGGFAYQVACRPLVEWAKNPRRAPDAGKSLPAFSTSSNADTERLLADYRAQIEAKNAQIASLEGWANEMQTRLKARPAGLPGLLNRFRKKSD